jgi:transcriptional regulator with PAS, ATPase and Fis domain
MNKNVLDISQDTLDMLVEYNWPGNIRELRNVIERAMVVARGNLIELDDLSFFFPVVETDVKESLPSLDEVEKDYIQKVLDQTNGNIAQAAAILKVSRLTMYNKIEKYQLKKNRPDSPH